MSAVQEVGDSSFNKHSGFARLTSLAHGFSYEQYREAGCLPTWYAIGLVAAASRPSACERIRDYVCRARERPPPTLKQTMPNWAQNVGLHGAGTCTCISR